jgi:hypothetical protein
LHAPKPHYCIIQISDEAKNEQLSCEIEDELDLVLKEKYGIEGTTPLHVGWSKTSSGRMMLEVT